MLINKAYKFRLYPNNLQITIINKTIGCTRLVYNHMLALKKENNYLSRFDMNKLLPLLKEEYPFLNEVDSCSLRCSIFNLENGFNRYYKKLGGMPKFKKKGINVSYRTNNITNEYKGKVYNSISVDLKRKEITLPKLKKVKITRGIVGIDLGVKTLVVTSDNEYYGNPKHLTKYERRIKKEQKKLSRQIKGSKNYKKTINKLDELYRKLRNARKKTAEDIVNKVIENNDVIVTETLNIKEMTKKENKNKSLRKEILNSTFGKIIKILEYKCKWAGKTIIKVSPYYSSSQICSYCNKKDQSMKDIRKREYKCTECGNVIERDINASMNILNEGIRILIERNDNRVND